MCIRDSQKCDQYINKAEAEKTDEQRYSEEQDAIDRQTKKKLQERADTEKMEHLPSEGNIAVSYTHLQRTYHTGLATA